MLVAVVAALDYLGAVDVAANASGWPAHVGRLEPDRAAVGQECSPADAGGEVVERGPFLHGVDLLVVGDAMRRAGR